MPKTVFMYPGQGSQYPTMGMPAIEKIAAAQELFLEASDYASEKLGRDVGKLMLRGSQEELNDTRIAQPVILIANIVGSTALREVLEYDANERVGHSFGHIAALHDDGVFDTATALDLAISRGEFMHQSSLDRPGAMAAVFKVAEDKLIETCHKHGIYWANDNSSTEAIVSGEKEAIEDAKADFEQSGGRVIELKVMVGAHSPLVKAAANRMYQLFDSLLVNQGKIHLPERLTVTSSRTKNRLKSLADIRDDIAGLTERVEWRNTIARLVTEGYVEFYETGPGSKLSNLPKRDPKMQNLLDKNTATMSSLDRLLENLAA